MKWEYCVWLEWFGIFIKCVCISDSSKADAPQILSKLFPQTSGGLDDTTKLEEKKKEEEEKQEQKNAWRRMKLG